MTIHVLPEKHVVASESVLGLGAIVLACLDGRTMGLDEIWAAVQDHEAVRHSVHGVVTLDSVILAVDFLFSVGAVHMSRDGVAANASDRTHC